MIYFSIKVSIFVLRFINWLKENLPVQHIGILNKKDFALINDKSYVEKVIDKKENFFEKIVSGFKRLLEKVAVYTPEKSLYIVWQFVMLSVIAFSYLYYPYILSFVVPFGELEKWH